MLIRSGGCVVFRSLRHIVVLISAIVLIAVVIWIDINTSLWQDLVIISGLAAGFVTFLLTSLFLNHFIQRSTQRHWAPVTRLALTEMLHQLADEDHSDLSQGRIQPRQLPTLAAATNPRILLISTDNLRATVVHERSHISTVLGTWWGFLSAASDTDGIMRQIADIALLFERVRDASLELDATVDQAEQHSLDDASRHALEVLNNQIVVCNASIARIVTEISSRLAADTTTLSQEAQQALARLRRDSSGAHRSRTDSPPV